MLVALWRQADDTKSFPSVSPIRPVNAPCWCMRPSRAVCLATVKGGYPMRKTYLGSGLGLVLAVGGCADGVADDIGVSESSLEAVVNSAGVAETFHVSGVVDRTNPFFESMGTNGRTCE